jgi:hypothetical protein
MKRIGALLLTAVLLTGSASALFGKKEPQMQPEEGAPLARDLEITTYREIPCDGQFLASDSEGDDMTFAVEEVPRKGTVTVDGANFTYVPNKGAVKPLIA